MGKEESGDALVRLLRNAYSGELAAGYAYRGHWKSLRVPHEIARVHEIENDEWVHRRRVGEMLDALGSGPSPAKEVRLWLVGRTIGLLCHWIGWFLPMYFAGRLESGNWKEYEEASAHASELGLDQFVEDLKKMAVVEKDHEDFFASMVSGHWLLGPARFLFGWGPTRSDQTAKTGRERAA
jgi:demethoxyubiquinone hydroxylase (CLK1/Coq7/Cat5 family)